MGEESLWQRQHKWVQYSSDENVIAHRGAVKDPYIPLQAAIILPMRYDQHQGKETR